MGTVNTSSSFEHRVNAVKDSLRQLVEQGSSRASHLKDRAIEVEHAAAAGTRAAAQRAGTWIKAHPVMSAAIALSLGYAVVRMARRR